MLIGTWRTTQENSATTRVEWDALGQVIRKARERLPYPKGASWEASLQSIGRSLGRTTAMTFRMRDSYASWIHSGFSRTSVTLERPRSATLPCLLGRGVWDSWPHGRWVTRLVGKDAQPLQSVKLIYQPCSWSWAARTLTWVIYETKLNLSYKLHCGCYY
jgi:hypothetical protein